MGSFARCRSISRGAESSEPHLFSPPAWRFRMSEVM